MTFRDRDDAGRQLAERLSEQAYESPVVLALPRGGVPVAAHVAAALNAPLEVYVARKIGAPGHPEYGIGAIAEGGNEIVVTGAVDQLGLGPEQMRRLADDERAELARRVSAYRGSTPLPPLEGRDVILVDDGLATGVTAEAAVRTLLAHHPRRVVLAVPVCPPDTRDRLSGIADEVVAITVPPDLGGIGAWYQDFSQTSDDEVVGVLERFRAGTGPRAAPGETP
ncbi:phosphoribosyltransferase [Phytoactinopolyspora halotolerans]|uniref:Phosphoribosyltransferase n=1 Tax=Phytoactinopolyspora halotolerans TaxID=1981512 RepID=A0A6L9SCK5_9ACTN|nr:phosphoribosyltransferase family protein [Phytoactinopolyspora halotolerans]NEE02322.1 phosphoribosyltransferase [Phytoactinopolyspora halotolerans]